MKNKKELLNLLEELNKIEDNNDVLLIDGFNLFMRNFTKINYLNQNGNHIGGLGGFLRSLGFLLKEIKSKEVYIIFDGVGSSYNRKALLPEYKEKRKKEKLSNKNIFNSLQEEEESKNNQIIRLIQYLRCLPIKIVSIDRVEADDIIAYLALKFKNKKITIVSSDNDFFQLINENIKIYRPQEKVTYNTDLFIDKFNIIPDNYAVYKTLIGDTADNIKGIENLGPKTLLQKFPFIFEKNKITLNDVFEFALENHNKHKIYSTIILEKQKLLNTFKVVDLSNPWIYDEEDKKLLNNIINEDVNLLNINLFMQLFNEDRLDNTIRNVKNWLHQFIYLNIKQ